jgi:hypothetical protein
LEANSGIQKFPQKEISAETFLYPTSNYILVANCEIKPIVDQNYALRIFTNKLITVN